MNSDPTLFDFLLLGLQAIMMIALCHAHNRIDKLEQLLSQKAKP